MPRGLNKSSLYLIHICKNRSSRNLHQIWRSCRPCWRNQLRPIVSEMGLRVSILQKVKFALSHWQQQLPLTQRPRLAQSLSLWLAYNLTW